MKIKNAIILFFALLVISNLSAQDSTNQSSKEDCTREYSIFAQSAKIKDYDSAKPHYQNLVKDCPQVGMALYQYGERMFKHYLDESKDETQKKEVAKKLIKNYKDRLKYFPEKTDEVSTDRKIAQLEVDYNIGTLEEQYQLFDKTWKMDKESFTDPKGLYTYFSLLIDLQDQGKKDLEDVFRKYEEVMGKINKEEAMRAEKEESLRKKEESGTTLTAKEQREKKNNEIYLTNYMKIKESIDAKVGTRADCDNLIPLYKKKFDAHKTDVEWLKIAASRLSAKKCTKGDLFFNITKALNNVEPSAKSAKYLGQLAAHKGKTSEAIKYYKQSIDLENNKLDKAKVYYRIANMYKNQGSLSTARANYRKALKNNPSLGSAYIKIAEMYASSVNKCGDNVFEKQSVYWLAADYAKRAARVDPSLRSTAKKIAASYAAHAPSKSDIFKAGKSGQTISIKCWINEKVTVPTL